MKHIFLLAVVLITVSTFTFGQTTSAKGATGDEQSIRQLLQDVGAAITRGDITTLENLYADDFTLINAGGELLDKEVSLAALRSGKVKFESFNMDDLKVRRYGDTAVVTARVTVNAKNEGQEMSGISRNTMTVVKSKGSWKLAATQVTPIR